MRSRLLADAVFGQLAGAGLVLDHGEGLARIGRAVQAQDLDRLGRAGLGHLLVALVDQGAHAAPVGAGDDDVAALQRAALDQHGGHGAAAAVELGLDHHAFGGAVGVGACRSITSACSRIASIRSSRPIFLVAETSIDLGVAAQALDHDLVLQQLVDHPGRVGVGLVDLVDGHDDRRAGRLGVMDGLDRLRHDAVVGRHHQHHDVGDVGAAGAHGREGRVAGRVEEGDALAVGQAHLIGADVLGDAAVFAGGHVGGAQGVQQAGLAVVDVAHDRHHRRARQQVVVDVLGGDEARLRRRDSDTRRTVWPNSVATSSAVSVSITSLIFSIRPWRIRNLMISTPRMAIRLASSCTVITSGMTTSRRGAGLLLGRRPCASRVRVRGPGEPRPGSACVRRRPRRRRPRPGWSGGLRGAWARPWCARPPWRAPRRPCAAASSSSSSGRRIGRAAGSAWRVGALISGAGRRGAGAGAARRAAGRAPPPRARGQRRIATVSPAPGRRSPRGPPKPPPSRGGRSPRGAPKPPPSGRTIAAAGAERRLHAADDRHAGAIAWLPVAADARRAERRSRLPAAADDHARSAVARPSRGGGRSPRGAPKPAFARRRTIAARAP